MVVLLDSFPIKVIRRSITVLTYSPAEDKPGFDLLKVNGQPDSGVGCQSPKGKGLGFTISVNAS
jgi:hypothetical protein